MNEQNKRMEKQNGRIDGLKDNAIRNYNQPDPLNTGCIGKSITVTLSNGRIEAGILTGLGAYWLSIQGTNGKELLLNKGAILVVAVL